MSKEARKGAPRCIRCECYKPRDGSTLGVVRK